MLLLVFHDNKPGRMAQRRRHSRFLQCLQDAEVFLTNCQVYSVHIHICAHSLYNLKIVCIHTHMCHNYSHINTHMQTRIQTQYCSEETPNYNGRRIVSMGYQRDRENAFWKLLACDQLCLKPAQRSRWREKLKKVRSFFVSHSLRPKKKEGRKRLIVMSQDAFPSH